MISLSVIVTTYNWPQALEAVLRALSKQKGPEIEILIADDGSDKKTQETIEAWQKKMPHPTRHIWQPDQGFRAAKARNRAIAQAKNDFVVFLDGDCVLPEGVLARYATMAEPGSFISGNRILLQSALTQKLLEHQIAFENWSLFRWIYHWMRRGCNRWIPLMTLPLGSLRHRQPQTWEGVKTCNLGVWRQDLWAVNGLDEDYTGWGYEDSDLVIRLLRAGIRRKEGRFAVPVLHLWHPEQSRSRAKENFARLASIQNSTRIKAVLGLDQYLDSTQDQSA